MKVSIVSTNSYLVFHFKMLRKTEEQMERVETIKKAEQQLVCDSTNIKHIFILSDNNTRSNRLHLN